MTDRAAGPGLLDRLLRPGRNDLAAVREDLIWLIGLGCLLIGAGIGLRDPWPPDEPRFVLIARDMLATGDWLVPRVAGDIYTQKPPFFFWLMAASMGVTGSLRVGFLVPSLLAGVGTVLLVYDLLRRVRGREVALAGALMLVATVQFTWQARQAQIDATLCFLATLSLYGLLRHLLVAPAPGWFVAGWAAAGLGVITKGVGFLPLFVLIPAGVLAARGWPRAGRITPTLVILGPVAMLAAIAIWFVPMMLVTGSDGALLEYRNELLFRQTVTRYAHPWHHREPVWYYLVAVIPLFWLPLIALVPWLWPRWRSALRDRDTLTAVLLAWVLMVVAFFSASSGKRGVYMLPAVPALAMAAAPWLPKLLRGRGPRRLAFALVTVVTGVFAVAAAYASLAGEGAERSFSIANVDPLVPLALLAACCGAMLAVFRVRDAWLAWLGTLASVWLVTGFVVYPRIDAARSGKAFARSVEERAAGIRELGFVDLREQFALQLARPIVYFGRGRMLDREREAADAAAWLAAGSNRAIVVDTQAREVCFADSRADALGHWHRDDWFLVHDAPDAACVSRGSLAAARRYVPPKGALNTDS
jgi:4-amino-4-deoxy-L-arabinose transferase-like glycosyltransferase